MLEQKSKNFKKLFLRAFIRQLIKSSNPQIFFELDQKLKDLEKEQRIELEKIKTVHKVKEYFKEQKESLKKSSQSIKEPLPETKKQPTPSNQTPPKIQRGIPKVLRVPEPRLPPQFAYLRPKPTDLKIDLGKLNVFMRDPKVMEIECEGPNIPIKVKVPNTMPTEILLTDSEIKQVVQTISKEAKIPAAEGFFRAVVDNFTFSAIISEEMGSKFVIKKISQPQQTPKRMPSRRSPTMRH